MIFRLSTYLSIFFHSVTLGIAGQSQEKFKKLLQHGAFVFVLDGFDEINWNKRPDIEKALMDFTEIFSKNIFVVSGRPSESLESWQSFYRFHVKKLDYDKIKKLVDGIDYQAEIKKNFLSAVKKGELRKHQDFLATPLLATIMLMTFDDIAEIPGKMHVFYERAFDALFLKHDLSKAGFKRKRFTTYSFDVFKKKCSNVFLLMYNDGVTELSDENLREYVSRSIAVDSETVDVENFVKDLEQSVCLFIRDGMLLRIIHRSFIEYFVAFNISRQTGPRVYKICEKLLPRYDDAVFSMIYDMNKDVFEENFVIPKMEAIKERWAQINMSVSIYKYIRDLNIEIVITRVDRRSVWTLHTGGADFLFILLLRKLYNEGNSLEKKMKGYIRTDRQAVPKWPMDSNPVARVGGSKIERYTLSWNEVCDENGNALSEEQSLAIKDWFQSTSHSKFLLDSFRKLEVLSRTLRKKTRLRTDKFLEIFS